MVAFEPFGVAQRVFAAPAPETAGSAVNETKVRFSSAQPLLQQPNEAKGPFQAH